MDYTLTMNTLDKKIEAFPRIGKKYGDILRRLDIETLRDFLLHFPFRYEDYSERTHIDNVSAGTSVTLMGEITQSKLIRTWKKKMLITECYVSDETGTIRAVWFNQPYISDSLTIGKGVRLSGKISEDKNGFFLSNPSWELSSRTPTNTGRLVPIYPETEGLSSKWIRWQMQSLIRYVDEFKDPLPERILKELNFPSIAEAIKNIHFPKSQEQAEISQKRFVFQEIFIMQLVSLNIKIDWDNQKAANIPFPENLIKEFVLQLPFKLTDAQRKSAFQIFKDLEKPRPMNRLLNGDVGSGKTMVAALATLSAANAGYQTAIMAPTEVLARQHYESISKLFTHQKINVGLLTNAYQESSLAKISGSDEKISKSKKRESILNKIKNGEINLIIGTHALIQKDIFFKNLALVIIDEQHRFGVSQRAYLQQKSSEINDGLKDKIPHFLAMTATPIPRTLALAFFGNLDISVLDEMPKNRKPIKTEIVTSRNREKMYDFIRQEIASGRQAFIIFPLVEESAVLTEVKAATEEHRRLSEKVFSQLKLALLHGKMKAAEKEEVMADFKNKKYDILVATSVVEVGIDVPNATVIIIEDADRFGLSQLHQFRGRVGRGEFQSYCFLLTEKSTEKTKSRLRALVNSSSGFVIAEEDLKLRGPGEFLGTRQSGLPDITMQHITDVKLIETAHEYAEQLINEDSKLIMHPLLKEELSRFTKFAHLE